MMLSDVINQRNLPVDVAVAGITDDSRRVSAGDIFCAVSGANFDGRRFVDAAVASGAVAVLCEPPVIEASVPVVAFDGLTDKLGKLASRVYGHPSADIDVVAVTGTNGKTSFTHFLCQALGSIDRQAGLIGTMGHGVPGHLVEPGLTTPPAMDIQRRVRGLVDDGCSVVVLEASSHGLVQGRLDGLVVDTAVFTNLSHDHLDYHETLSSYQDAKARLFRISSVSNAVVNLDDGFAQELIARLSVDVRLITFSRKDKRAGVYCAEVICSPKGLDVVLMLNNELVEVRLPLYGLFNLENVLAVVATLQAMRVPVSQIIESLKALTPVAGRMDILTQAETPSVIVDYAHTPDALEKSLEAVGMHFKGRKVHCVFGCGGDRDHTKRPMMGEIASRLAERVVLTSDNPRSEDPEKILEDIKKGVGPGEVEVVANREEAILCAIAGADAGDVVLVAGKGHEDYQELASGRIPFSDYAVIAQVIERWKDSHVRGS